MKPVSRSYAFLMSKLYEKGFTMAELLIAMSILGIIATVSIPKVLGSFEITQNKTVMKEAISSLHHVLYKAWQEGDSRTVSELLKDHLNVSNVCPPNDVSGECADAYWGSLSSWSYVEHERFVLTSGAIIFILSEGEFPIFLFARLKNGTNGTFGNYTLQALIFNRSDTIFSNADVNNLRPGELKPTLWNPAYQQEYNNLFGGN
jgi:prepilin-type N-terminal cleavage/methylation domain-containing protein